MAYPAEVKAAVMAELLAGAGVVETAKRHEIDHSTISRWRQAALRMSGRTDDVGLLLTAYLTELLETLRAQAITVRKEDWLLKQDASAVAVLHGVLNDKAVRLLEALARPPASNGNALPDE